MKQNRKQPWNETFSDVRDSSGHLSRTKLHRQNHNNNVITVILVVIIGLIAVFALIYGLANNTLGHDGGHQASTRISRVSHKTDRHKHAKKRHHSDEDSSVSKPSEPTSTTESHSSDLSTSVPSSSKSTASSASRDSSDKGSISASSTSKPVNQPSQKPSQNPVGPKSNR